MKKFLFLTLLGLMCLVSVGDARAGCLIETQDESDSVVVTKDVVSPVEISIVAPVELYAVEFTSDGFDRSTGIPELQGSQIDRMFTRQKISILHIDPGNS